MVTPLASPLYAGLLAASPVAALFADTAEIGAAIRFEAALARAQEAAGVLPAGAGAPLAAALERIAADEAELAAIAGEVGAETTRSGMPLPGLVEALGRRLRDHRDHLHFGATSQDAMDTGLVLRLAEALGAIEELVSGLIATLAPLADRHRGDVVLARTRWQGAAPTSLGLKVAGWLDPLVRLKAELGPLRARALAVQLGGSVGNLAHMDGKGMAVMAALAADLGLAPAHPWHAARDRLADLSGWLARLAAAAGKVATDILLMAASEVREARLADGGGSSTLPHKQNPVDAEIVVALARHAATLCGEMHAAAIGAHERDGAAWTGEWLALPALVASAHGAVAVLARAVAGLSFDTRRMAANLSADGGLAHAEGATFALARHMPRAEARALVKAAIADGRERPGFDLLKALAASTEAPVDWADVRAAGPALKAAAPMIDRVLAAARG